MTEYPFDEPIDVLRLKLKLAEKSIELSRITNLRLGKMAELRSVREKEELLLLEIFSLTESIEQSMNGHECTPH
jgi:hypothetical protein